MTDCRQIAAPQIVDHVIGGTEHLVLHLENREQRLEIGRARVVRERQLAQSIAIEREEEGFFALLTIDHRDLVEIQVGRSEPKRERLVARSGVTLFDDFLVRFSIRLAGRVIEPSRGQSLFDLQNELADLLDGGSHGI